MRQHWSTLPISIFGTVGSGAGGQECLAPPPNQNLARACKSPGANPPDALVLKNSFTDVFDIGDFRAHIFCPQTIQELPKKHHEAGPTGTPTY